MRAVLIIRSLDTGPAGEEALAIIPNPALVARVLEILGDAVLFGIETATRPVVEVPEEVVRRGG
jgi:hypothetical protein